MKGYFSRQSGQDRREVLANWLASPENPYFARNLANIVWAHFMGKGIIDPVDDVRVSNPPSNPELLEALGAKFTEYRYDFKRLVRDTKQYEMPWVYLAGEFIGGYDALERMAREGKLDEPRRKPGT